MLTNVFRFRLRVFSYNRAFSTISSDSNSLDYSSLKVVLCGRPNVGKSTLFNRLVRGRKALMSSSPGLTRDRIEGIANLYGMRFTLVDTPGLDDQSAVEHPQLTHWMRQQTMQAIKGADAIVFMIDGVEGLTLADRQWVDWMRPRLPKYISSDQLVLVANKCESARTSHEMEEDKESRWEAYELGLGEPLLISAAHGEGLFELSQKLSLAFKGKSPCTEAEFNQELEQENLTDVKNVSKDVDLDEQEKALFEENADSKLLEYDDDYMISEELKSKTMKLSVIGRPNTGKSSLINAILGEGRLNTGEMPGLTRDSVTLRLDNEGGRKIQIVDTAGLRGTTIHSLHKSEKNDMLGMLKTRHSIRGSTVVAVTMSSTDVLSWEQGGILIASIPKREKNIISYVAKEGKPILILVTKWDLIPQDIRDKALEELDKAVMQTTFGKKGVTLLPVSINESRYHPKQMLSLAEKIHKKWCIKIPSRLLNAWLDQMQGFYNLTSSRQRTQKKKARKIQYILQVSTMPPTFALYGRLDMPTTDPFIRFLTNTLSKEFDFEGVPIQIIIKTREKRKTRVNKKGSMNKSSRKDVFSLLRKTN